MRSFSIRNKRSARRSRFHNPQSSRRSVSPRFERLEDRLMLSTITWDGGGNDFNWNNPLNWSTDALPGAADNVLIDYGANDFTVTHSSGTDAIHSLTSNVGLTVSGGELSVAADSQVFGPLNVSATLGGSGNIAVAGQFTWTGGTLRGVGGQGSLTANGGTAILNNLHRLEGGFHYVNPVGQTATWAGDRVLMNDHSIFDNDGILDLQSDTVMDSDALSEFNNSGTLIKSGGYPNNNGYSHEWHCRAFL